MTTSFTRIEETLKELQQGRMVILTDDPEREDEGDLIFPAEMVTPDKIRFMLRHCSGIICLPLTGSHLDQLHLPLMVPAQQNTSRMGTPFTISIEAKKGVTTGVSAADRATTILTAVRDGAQPDDLVCPGHVFPLRAKEGGVLERAGHTEGTIDLARLAGFKPAAVLCEVMNPDGTMAKGEQLKIFAKNHQLKILAIEELLHYRLCHENLIEETASTRLPMEGYGVFRLTVMREKLNGKEHLVLVKDQHHTKQPPLVRLHSACMTGDLFGSQRCDCQQQLHYSLKRISEEGGILIYLNQEGRGMGLFNKIKAYALQEKGMDTVEANQCLGWPADSRRYFMAANILRNWKIDHIRLLTNNPHKMNDLIRYGIPHIERIALPVFANQHNEHYLQTKKDKLNHFGNNTPFNNKTGTS